VTTSQPSPAGAGAAPPLPPPTGISGVGEAPVCPLCEYDLRGLAEPRCPECGYRFEWAELRDPARRIHPYLFEHHPERNVHFFLRTLFGGLRPRQFWSTLYPTQPSRPRRLLAYWIIFATPLLIAGIVHLYLMSEAVRAQAWGLRFRSYPPGALLRQTLNRDVRGPAFGMIALASVAWPAASLAALMVFQISMRRAKVRWVHVVRCVVYASDLVLWLTPPVVAGMAVYWIGASAPLHDLVAVGSVFLPIFAWGVFATRLSIAYQRYLKFDRPALTVLCSQLIVVLAYAKLDLIVQGF
jgi:hypothetical protein